MGRKERINILHLAAVIMLSSLLFIAGCGSKTVQSASETATTVKVATAAQRDIYGSTDYSGRLKASSEVNVLPETSARVVAIRVKEGQQVSAGETLMTLDSSSLQASVKKAEAQVASAKASQTTNQIKLEAARRTYERYKELRAVGAITESELETAQDDYATLQSGSVEASVYEAEAALLSAQEQIGYCNITAPVSGVVGRIDASAGEYVTASTIVAVVSDSRQLEDEIMVGESDISKIQLDSQVDVYVKSVSEEPFVGTITSIASVIDSTSDMYPVTVTLDNSAGQIKSGMFAEVLVDTSGVKNALCVPLSAIIPNNGADFVYTISAENTAKQVEVETGISDGTYVQIVSGLQVGDKVVTLGNTLISDGSLLETVSGEGE